MAVYVSSFIIFFLNHLDFSNPKLLPRSYLTSTSDLAFSNSSPHSFSRLYQILPFLRS
ncbi:hypothetical protein Lser_V15G42545 [Lactuca serriola]